MKNNDYKIIDIKNYLWVILRHIGNFFLRKYVYVTYEKMKELWNETFYIHNSSLFLSVKLPCHQFSLFGKSSMNKEGRIRKRVTYIPQVLAWPYGIIMSICLSVGPLNRRCTTLIPLLYNMYASTSVSKIVNNFPNYVRN